MKRWAMWLPLRGLVSNPSDPAEVAADPDFFDQLPYVDLNREVPRVRPRTIIDAAFGYEHRSNDLRVWEIVAQISNLTNKTALYNLDFSFCLVVGRHLRQPMASRCRGRSAAVMGYTGAAQRRMERAAH